MFISNHIDRDNLKKFSSLSIFSGIIMIIAGGLAIVNPWAGSMGFVLFIASMFLVMAFFVAFITLKAHNKSLGAWLKVFLLLITGLLLLILPGLGVATLAILFALYFFIDAFASLGLGFEMRPLKGWISSVINGILSLFLGIIMIYNWPFSSVVVVGIIIGVSFIMDGLFFVYLGMLSKKGYHE